MENRDTTVHNAIDEAVRQKLEHLEVPYSADDWEKIEGLLANRKPAKGVLNRVNINVNPEVVPSVSAIKKFSLSNVVLGLVIVTAVIVLLFRFFDDAASDQPEANDSTTDSVKDEDVVRGIDTLKTITQRVIKADSVSAVVASKAIQGIPVTPVVAKKTEVNTVLPTAQPVKPTLVKNLEAKPVSEKPAAKANVKMEIEEIEVTVPSPASLIKRKKVEAVIPKTQVVPQPAQSVQEVVTPQAPIPEDDNLEETRRELRKRKRQNSTEEQRPKSFRELDSIR